MTFSAPARLSGMSSNVSCRGPAPERPATLPRVLLWILVIAGFLLLSFAAALRADARTLPGSATRRQDFKASGTLKSLTIENVNGSVEIGPGPAFTAFVELTARAKDDREAKRILDETTAGFSNENGDMTLRVEPPGMRHRRGGRGGWDERRADGDAFRVEARCRVTVPPGVAVQASLVNGNLSAGGVTSDLALTSVNGKIDVAGASRSLRLSTVNGNVDAQVTELGKGSEVELKSVNGNLVLKLPSAAGFRFQGKTMGGEILSTFSLPVRAASGEDETVRVEKEKIRVETRKIREAVREAEREKRRLSREGDPEPIEIDLSELNRSLAEIDRELASMSRELARDITIHLNRSCEATVGGGGAAVRMSNLNGKILLLAEGTTEEQAKAVVGPRRVRIVQIPPVPPVPPLPAMARIPAAPSVPPPPPVPYEFGHPVVRGDIAGDFASSVPLGDVTLGHVSGNVKVATHSGQIEVKSAGKGADLSTAGGDIAIDAVTGSLAARTRGGDIRAGVVTGEARLETTGGDLVLKSGGAAVTARTGGGDVTVKSAKGPVVIRTAGGTVFCEIAGSDRSPVEIVSGGGDVTLVLPSNAKGDVEVAVAGVEPDGDYILSQFPELAISRRGSRQTAAGTLNGGGPRVVVRSTSGTVRVRRGPAAP